MFQGRYPVENAQQLCYLVPHQRNQDRRKITSTRLKEFEYSFGINGRISYTKPMRSGENVFRTTSRNTEIKLDKGSALASITHLFSGSVTRKNADHDLSVPRAQDSQTV